ALILLSLLRNQEETCRRRPAQGGVRGAEDNPDSKRRPPLTDLDRFLQEVHRRRMAAEGEETTEETSPRPVAPLIIPRRSGPASASRVPPGPGRRMARSGERQPSRRSAAAPIEVEAIPVAIPVEDTAAQSSARSGPEPSSTVF